MVTTSITDREKLSANDFLQFGARQWQRKLPSELLRQFVTIALAFSLVVDQSRHSHQFARNAGTSGTSVTMDRSAHKRKCYMQDASWGEQA